MVHRKEVLAPALFDVPLSDKRAKAHIVFAVPHYAEATLVHAFPFGVGKSMIWAGGPISVGVYILCKQDGPVLRPPLR